MSGFPTDIEAALLPWLVERAEIEVDKRVDGRTVLDGIIREVLAARLNRGAQVSYAFSIFFLHLRYNKLTTESIDEFSVTSMRIL